MKKSKIDQIMHRIVRHGNITRNWCLKRRITRLASVICSLRLKKGWEFKAINCITSYNGFKEPDYKYIVIRVGK